ncbi:MAG: hypothetical protein HN891_04620 [Planctomycetes bacterium]|jgi:MFS family permease|nr:hypothetical protein [Planctomycetota bacterium]MBT6451550.1 hypothetical protein [Planctomycetota bacterium]MBT6540067.1 hypothetical protein [Planctomycetota bacterium]MBT6968662.1 hypothetical protein [Planctomycetota bacterium]MBT7105112.1 hypothetical protein [Planctomycetota bacterium]
MSQVLDDAGKARLFWASCISLIATSIAFGVITSSMGDFSSMYGLSNAQAGWVGGASLGGFAVAIILLGPVIEKIGIAVSLKMAFVCHILGVILMMFADGFGQLMLGASVIAIGNGCVEAGCNPLVATLYSDNKTTRLNQFHVFWPVGIIIGALFGFWVSNAAADAALAAGVLADSASVVADPASWSVAFKTAYDAALTSWTLLGLSALQAKMALVLLPTLAYGYLFLGQEIPQTERIQSNVSDEQVTASITSPLFLLMLCCMGLTATLELGPGRWMGEIMTPAMQSSMGTSSTTAGAGILVLVYGSGLMAVLRYFAGGFVHKFSPTGLLMGSAVLGGVGLFAMTYAETFPAIFLTATVFYGGICFFWPTMLGFVSERIPNSGAMGLCLMGGAGMLVVGYVAAPAIGAIQDSYIAAYMVDNVGATAEAAAAYAGKMAFRWIAALAIPLALVFFNLNKKYGHVAAASVGSNKESTGSKSNQMQNSY